MHQPKNILLQLCPWGLVGEFMVIHQIAPNDKHNQNTL